MAVKDEDVRRRHRAVQTRGCLLIAVVEEREIELPVSGAGFHLFERIAEVCITHLIEPERLRAVRLDDDKGDAALAVIGDQFLDAVLINLGGRAMHRREDDDQDFAVFETGQRVSLAIDARQMKIRRD